MVKWVSAVRMLIQRGDQTGFRGRRSVWGLMKQEAKGEAGDIHMARVRVVRRGMQQQQAAGRCSGRSHTFTLAAFEAGCRLALDP